MKKGKWLLTALIVATLLIAGCSSKSGNSDQNTVSSEPGASSTAGASESNKGAPTTIKIFSQFMPADELDDGYYTKFIEDKFNIKIEWNAASRETFEEKKKLVMASGDYPDIFLGESFFTKQEQALYGQQGILEPLNDLIDQYGTNIKSHVLTQFPDFLNDNTSPDGNIYGLGSIDECFHCKFPMRMWINTTWLANLKLDMPTTTEEYYQVLKAFKERDPNGNNKADEIPLSGTEKGWNTNVDGFLMNAFIYNNPYSYLTLNGGKIEFVANRPEWKEGLQYLNKLYKEGLLDKNAFIQDGDALGQLGMYPDAALLGSFPHGVSYGVAWPDDNGSTRYKEYQALPPLKGPGGVQLAFEIPSGISVSNFSISANSKHKELAMQIADYFYSEEGTVGMQRGREGIDWKKAESGEVGYDGRPATVAILPTDGPSWNNLGPHMMSLEMRNAEAVPQDPDNPDASELKWFQAAEKYEPYGPEELIQPMFIESVELNELTQIQADILRYVKESMVKFILGDWNFERDWDNYVSKFSGFKLDRYVAIHQKALDNLNK